MANKEKGEVSLSIDGKEYVLRLNHNRISDLYDYGIDFLRSPDITIKALRAILFVCLKGQNGIAKIEDAGDLMDEDPGACTEAVTEAVTLFFRMYETNGMATPATP